MGAAMKIIKKIAILILFMSLSGVQNLVAAEWSPLVKIGAQNSTPSLALDNNGNAVAVWIHKDETGPCVQAATQAFKGNWSNLTNLSCGKGSGLEASVAVDGKGNAIALWNVLNNGIYSIYTASLPAGGKKWMMTDSPLATSTDEIYWSSLLMNDQGDALALWIQTSQLGIEGTFQGARFSAESKKWELLENFPQPNIRDFSFAIDPAGNAVLVWQELLEADLIKASTLNRNASSWSLPKIISEPDVELPRVHVDKKGNAVATWAEPDSFRSQASILPFGASDWIRTNLSDLKHYYAWRVAIDSEGNLLALLYTSDFKQYYSSVLPAGKSTWDAPLFIAPVPQDGNGQELLLDKSDNAMVFFGGPANSIQTTYLLKKTQSWSKPETIPNVKVPSGNYFMVSKISSKNSTVMFIYPEYEKETNTLQSLNGFNLFPSKTKKAKEPR